MSIDRLGIFGDKPTDEDYKDAFNHIRALADLEWNGSITITHFRDRVNDIITAISEKESKWVKKKEMKEDSQS